ncbi:hypothetical protein ADU59_19820 [Pararhizobium polonicum]|uniref:Adenylate cyclase n=1 Tax=Pararhizobium polonicum TaxID=1612624 RepID=A0A1C7NY72_9HYPH|nr:hypothetical protein [Pararhizobium polonicum]OBZ93938.1 hypothetical protein ADU59_19820 [Pararhizobium polonicum]
MDPHQRPDDQTIRQSLDRVLSSALFSRSERLRAFLKYVVDREIEGVGHQLKGYTIGIDVFDRPQAFNADSDPLVRVHAGKLRKLLAAYYTSEGVRDEWRIDIPKGTYVPEYRRNRLSPSAPPVEAARPPAQPRRVANRRFSWLPAPLSSPLAVLSALPLLIFIPLSSPAMSVNIPAQSRLHGAVLERKFANDLPRITVRAQWPRNGNAGRFADALRNAASHYRTIAAVPPAVQRQQSSSATADPLAFTISVSQQTAPAGLQVLVTNDASAETVYDGFIDGAQLADEGDILYESLALAGKILSSDGYIFRYAGTAEIDSPLMKCMVLTDNYRLLQTRETFQDAKSCQERLSADHRRKLKFVISAAALPSTLIR